MTYYLYGNKVVVSPYIVPIPVIKTDTNFKWCSDAFRAKHDAWLLERFGTYLPTYVMGDTIVVHPETFALIKAGLPLS